MSARKQTRRLSAGWIFAMVAVGVTLLVVVGVFGVRSMTRRMDAAKLLDQAIVLSQQADSTVIGVDSVVRAKVTPELAAKVAEVEKKLPSAHKQLADALALIDRAYPGLNDDERKQATALKDADTARTELLDAAEPLLAANKQAAAALPPASEAYDLLVKAEKDSDAAVRNYNQLTKGGVRQSLTLNQSARNELVKAKTLFTQAQKAFPAAGLKPFLDYTAARIALVDVSIESDRAYLSGDVTKANSLAADFNAAEKRMTAAAKRLPASPSEVIAKAYDETTVDATTAYFAARNAASQADQRLRER